MHILHLLFAIEKTDRCIKNKISFLIIECINVIVNGKRSQSI